MLHQKDKNIRVAILGPYSVFPARTGGKKFIALFYEYLAKVLRVEFIGVEENEIPAFAKEPFHKVLGSSRLRYLNPFLFSRLKQLILQQGITDLIIVHPYYGWLAALLKKSTGVRLSLLSHNIESERFRSMGKWWWRMMWRYEKKIHGLLDHNFFVTDEDMQYGVKNYGLDPSKCDVITYGIEWDKKPGDEERRNASEQLKQIHNLDGTTRILLFNGSLDYSPNIEAVNYILEKINPLLLQQPNFKYKIIICGKGLPASYQNLEAYKEKNIIYAGFVEDINLYFLGANVFLNPVISGGGIKTKLVEALGNNVTSVSCSTGAYGVPASLTNNQLEIVADHDWENFVKKILDANDDSDIPPEFFDYFYWGNIAAKAAEIIRS